MTETREDDPTDEAVRTAHAPGPAPISTVGEDGFDPFAKLFQLNGEIDQEYMRKRVPALVELLRGHPACFPVRIDHERLGSRLLEDDARTLRDADDQEAFEQGLAQFSREHLHELIDDEMQETAGRLLNALTGDTNLSRRSRVAAALGVTFLSGVPDPAGLSGRPLFDLVFRVSLEELHAQEQLRKTSAESADGLSPEELEQFWKSYPALRYAYEQRYRREVRYVLDQIEEGGFPLGISVDLALRGAFQLRRAAAAAGSEGQEFDHVAAQKALREPFDADVLLEDGGRLVLERWQHACDNVRGSSRDRRAYVRTVGTGSRLVADGGPGGDAILFYTYLQSIVDGQFYIEEDSEAEVARAVFTPEGMNADGVLAYADYHMEKGRPEAAQRLLCAAFEIWPDNAAVRERFESLGAKEMEAARAERQGPHYDVVEPEAAAAPEAETKQPAEDA